MAILKYAYLSLGIILFVFFNILSYSNPTFHGNFSTKIIFSILSFGLMVLDYLVILKSEWILKKPFQSFTTYTKVMLYLGVIITPLISLYYQS